MDFKPMLKDPINLRMSHHGCHMLADENFEKAVPLKPGVVIGSEHYGFTLIVDFEEKQSETTYPTQCRISAVGIENDVLVVFEDDKYIPWRFDKNGIFLNEAKFLEQSRRDCDFLAQNLGIVGAKQIEEVNAYRKR